MCSPQFMRVFLLFVGACIQRSLEFGGFVVAARKATVRRDDLRQHSFCHDLSEMCSTQLKPSHVRNLDNNNPAPRVAPGMGLFDPHYRTTQLMSTASRLLPSPSGVRCHLFISLPFWRSASVLLRMAKLGEIAVEW